MNCTKAGIILYTDKYQDCVAFYRDALQLPLMFQFDRPGETLTCFDLGGAYLMVEVGGPPSRDIKTMDHSPIKFRFNVPEVEAVAKQLRDRGVKIALHRHDWGDTAEFTDPDGNRCALRSDRGFGV